MIEEDDNFGGNDGSNVNVGQDESGNHSAAGGEMPDGKLLGTGPGSSEIGRAIGTIPELLNECNNNLEIERKSFEIEGGIIEDDGDDDGENSNDPEALMTPLVLNTSSSISASGENEIRSRKRTTSGEIKPIVDKVARSSKQFYNKRHERLRECCDKALEIQRNVLRNTISFMNFLAKILFWFSLLAMSVGVIWYSRELAVNGTESHLIAWFSAGGFVILGFPISIYGILMHLTNYYQPNIQCYVVRILWMVPIYSIESWLCLRYHEFAIYIETLRDCYESFVLYCFLQFLIEVLGGEESLIMLLKDKSPTRGMHIWGMGFCIKPWVMGQPISTVDEKTGQRQVRWTSPFFKNCKLGCLQYVLLKLITSMFVMVLERFDLYKEGNFSPKFGYFYICILTNTSQCWALYCLVFFYYATKNELGPIRPVGKFLAVKALVFFTWWQSVGIAFLNSLGLIPEYKEGGWSVEEVAKGLQAYLICIEMFAAAIVHIFVFPHTDYMRPLAVSKSQKGTGGGVRNFGRRLGRRANRRYYSGLGRDDKSVCSKMSDAPSSMYDYENHSLESPQKAATEENGSGSFNQSMRVTDADKISLPSTVDDASSKHPAGPILHPDPTLVKQKRTGFVNALIDSAIPNDVMDNTVGIARGDFHVEKKTLLYHAAASDEYSLFAKRRKAMEGKKALTKKAP